MANPQEVNRQVALALGRVIIPLAKADCHTHAEGVSYLYSDALRLFRTVRLSTDGNSCIATDEFNPAENPADALACLEEWQAKSHGSWLLSQEGKRFYCVDLVWPTGKSLENHKTSMCEAICQAILAAQGDAK
jgi:hypothetical protein